MLLFLHADTDLPEGAIAAIQASHGQPHPATVVPKSPSSTARFGQAALGDTRVMGGCFELRFHEEGQSWTLQLWSSLERNSIKSTCSFDAWPVLNRLCLDSERCSRNGPLTPSESLPSCHKFVEFATICPSCPRLVHAGGMLQIDTFGFRRPRDFRAAHCLRAAEWVQARQPMSQQLTQQVLFSLSISQPFDIA